jgi:hypothetical protein
MSWVRSNLRFGSWCALFALAVQLIVLFNHVHCAGNVCWPGSAPAIGATGNALADVPAPGKRSVPTIEYCMVCAVVHLAASALPAATAAPLVPVVVNPVRFWTDLSIVFAAPPHQIFQARAPPSA